MITHPKNSLSQGTLIVWCKLGNPPFSAKTGVKQPQSHTEHLHVPAVQQNSMHEILKVVFGKLRKYKHARWRHAQLSEVGWLGGGRLWGRPVNKASIQ
eukprot:655531-Pelagomonas_calceolata.AAC.27